MLVIPLTLLEICLCIVSGIMFCFLWSLLCFAVFKGKNQFRLLRSLFSFGLSLCLVGLDAKWKMLVHKYERCLSIFYMEERIWGSAVLGSKCIPSEGRWTQRLVSRKRAVEKGGGYCPPEQQLTDLVLPCRQKNSRSSQRCYLQIF